MTVARWLLVLHLAGLAASLPAEAALAVSPSRVVLTAKPQQKRVGFFMVENRGEVPLTVNVEPEDWSQGLSGERGRVNWLRVTPGHLTLQPGARANVKYVIRVPRDASGELRVQVFFTTGGDGEASTSLRSRLGTIIYVGIAGTERVGAMLTQLEAQYTVGTPGATRPDRLDVAVGVRNRGNVHVIPEGEVLIRDERGEVAERLPLQGGWGLLPDEEDFYHAIGHGVYLKAGRYTFEVTVHYGDDVQHPMTLTKTFLATLTPQAEVRLERY